jgi:hypothetical protein
MPDNEPEPYELEDEALDKPVTIRRSHINALEAKAKTAQEAAERAEKAERRLAFAEAGISLADPKLAYFVKGYDGELTVEAIQAAATEAGFLTPDGQQQEAQASAAAASRVNAAAAGALPPTNDAERQRQYADAFQEAVTSGNWDAFNAVASQNGPVVGINLPPV